MKTKDIKKMTKKELIAEFNEVMTELEKKASKYYASS